MSAEKTLSINSELFKDMREMFDEQFSTALVKMQSYGLEQGSITLKLDIDLTGTPAFEYTVKSSLPVKDKLSGFARRENTHIEWSKEERAWTLEPDGPSLFDREA